MFQNFILTESARSLRANARELLRGKWGGAIITVLLYQLLLNLPPLLIGLAFSEDSAANFANLYTLFVRGPFDFGLVIYFLTMYRTRNEHTMLIFQGFEFFFKTFMMTLFIAIFTMLWSLLLIFPGIMAAYSYSMSFYVLADHPEYTPLQCIAESKRLMRGNRWKLFCLELSFIGWNILASIPAIIYTSYLNINGKVDFTDFMSVANLYNSPAMTALVLLPTIALVAYVNGAKTVFYEHLSGRGSWINPVVEPQPVEQPYTNFPQQGGPFPPQGGQFPPQGGNGGGYYGGGR